MSETDERSLREKVVGGYRKGKEKYRSARDGLSSAKQSVAGSGSIAAPFLVGLGVFLADAFFGGFNRTGNYLYIYGIAYSVVGFLTFMSLRGSADTAWLRRHCALLTGVSWLLPLFLSLAAGFLSENAFAAAGFFTADLLAKLMSPYMPLIFVYLVGWPKFLFEHAAAAGGGLGKFANIVHTIAIFLIFLAVLLPFMSALQQSELARQAGVSGYQFDKVSFGDMIGDAWGLLGKTTDSVWQGVTGQVNDSFAAATVRPYTGTVERQQGRLLGVNVKDVRASKPVYNFLQEDGELRVDADSQALWFGTVEARTFAEDMNVSLACLYEYSPRGSREQEQVVVPARPEDISVSFTGDFVDSYPFDCAVPLQGILDAAGEQALYGQFFTTADFSFQTWGYSTVTFMDRSVITELRREGKDPARQLGLNSYVQAKYTPGPVSLGMLDKQPLPFGVDLQEPERNNLPPFGVTLQNTWYGRGEVTQLHELILQVPEPLVLDTTSCSGYEGQVQERLSGFLQDGEVPEGYRWYVFEEVVFEEDQQLKTIRCPLRVQGDSWERLLGADLSARQFTLVARAKYDYMSKTPVPVRLGAERFS